MIILNAKEAGGQSDRRLWPHVLCVLRLTSCVVHVKNDLKRMSHETENKNKTRHCLQKVLDEIKTKTDTPSLTNILLQTCNIIASHFYNCIKLLKEKLYFF